MKVSTKIYVILLVGGIGLPIVGSNQLTSADQLIDAISQGSRADVERLLAAGASVNSKGGVSNETPLEAAFWVNKPEIARLLLQAGATPDIDTSRLKIIIQSIVAPENRKKSVDKAFTDRKVILDMEFEFFILKDLADYIESNKQLESKDKIDMLDKFQKAFKAYLWQNQRPLIDLLCNELYDKPEMLLVVDEFFDDLDACFSCWLESFMEKVPQGVMTAQQSTKIQALADKIRDMNRAHSAANTIQQAWLKHKKAAKA